MKKFKFTLQSIFEYKQTVEKTQKTELKRAETELNQLRDQERKLDEAFERTKDSQKETIVRNVNLTGELATHDSYFRYLREAKAKLFAEIDKAQLRRNVCQDALILTMKQIKTYTKLRDEQYQTYLHEVQIEEEKAMGDLVSFNSASAF